jgi:hypothetical protein
MKKSLLLILVAGGLGFACACGWLKHSLKQQQDDFAGLQAAWQSEKSGLEDALASARGRVTVLPGKTQTVEVDGKISPEEILARLKTMKIVADQPRSARLVGHEFENLIACGPAALPAIRNFLAGNTDVDYDTNTFIKSVRGGKLPTEFNVPPSLRLGLFEVLKDIGGEEAEQILADALVSSGRGLEVAFLARVLEQLSPGTYRAVVVQVAHDLLARSSPGAADKDDRNFLFATLTFLNDPSFAAQAQAQMIQPDGKVDAAALKYLQQTKPKEALALALQAYQDPRVTDANAKERLVQVALDFAGTDPQADNFFYAAMGDASLPADIRDNLAQDFADHGTNPKNPSAQDIQVMQKRLAMLQQLQGETTDPKVLAGIMEGQKDLNKFIAKYAALHP